MAPPSHTPADVVLLHGLARGPWSMALLGRRLAKAGFRVHNLSYPSRPESLDEAVQALRQAVDRRRLAESEGLNWVTYSLGGLVARSYLARFRPEGRDRMVMMAPPNQGTPIVDSIGHFRVFRLAFGELATQLGTASDSVPSRLEALRAETGVIAGNRWINPVGGWLLDEDHDGTVTVDGTRLPGLADHLVLPHTHSFMMNAPRVAAEATHFLRHGRFSVDGRSRAA